MKRSPSLHRSSTLDATSCCQPLRSQPSSWLAWRRPHTMRELPTMEVRIPRLLGRTLLHWRRPPVGMPFQIKNKLSSHIGVALANHSQAIGRTSPECGCARDRDALRRPIPPQRWWHCGSFSDSVWLYWTHMQNGTEAPSQTFFMHGREF